jgi:prepilin-type N-terminal cleavage/methylation domain-containing protein
MRHFSQPTRGFSLPELMVVLSIIMLLVVMSLPNMERAKEKAEEGVTRANMNAIRQSQEAYRITNGNYAPSFAELTDVGKGPLLEGEIGGGSGGEDVLFYKGYIFRMKRPTGDQYFLTAEPAKNRNNRPWWRADHKRQPFEIPPGDTFQEGSGTGE